MDSTAARIWKMIECLKKRVEDKDEDDEVVVVVVVVTG